MTQATWAAILAMANKLGCTVTRKKKFLRPYYEIRVSPTDGYMEWASGQQRDGHDLELAYTYLSTVQEWKLRQEIATAERQALQELKDNARHPPPGAFRYSPANYQRRQGSRSTENHNPNTDPVALLAIQNALLSGENTPRHTSGWDNYDLPSTSPDSSDNNSPGD